jgi:3-hydroxyisobutyrate dehydrogenase
MTALPDPLRVGFVGTGLMGAPMVRRLLDAGFGTTVWNRTEAKSRALETHGANVAAGPKGVAEASDVICLCLADTAAVEDVVFGAEGFATDPGSCRILVDFSSIRPDTTVDMARRLADATGIDWVDAPVSGGVRGAADGTLIVLCGGSEQAVAAASPVFDAVSRRVSHMGGVGAGQATKLCNQAIVATNLMAIAEAMVLAKGAGIDPGMLPGALAGGWADSLPLQILGPLLADADAEAKTGALRLMQKDVETACDVAMAAGSGLSVIEHVADAYRRACEAGYEDKDITSLGAYLGVKPG